MRSSSTLLRRLAAAILVAYAATGVAGAAVSAGPASTAPPTVVGVAAAGQQLLGAPGYWAAAGTLHYKYQWYRCDASGARCAAIHGATSLTVTLVDADVGNTLGLTVSASDSTGTTAASASLVGPIAPRSSPLADGVRPVLTGAASVGGTLATSNGTWTQTPRSFAYAWQRCDAGGRACAPIAGATTATYVPTGTDVGHVLVARVTATAAGKSQPTFSLGSKAVTTAGATPPPPTTSSPVPTISGAARVGTRLTSLPPTAASGATFGYQWYRCDAAGAHCASIHGATGSSYKTVAADAGKTIALTANVTAGGSTTPSYSSLLGPIAVANAPIAATTQAAPVGVPTQGQLLTLTGGTWSAATSSFTYAWQRCNGNGRICTPIEGATAASYTPTVADVGHRLLAAVTAKGATATVTALSSATAAIAALPVLTNTIVPSVAGSEKVGLKLTASPGTWTGTAPISFSYQWYRCDASAAHCASIHGATAASYKLVSADAAKTIGLTVTAKDSTGTKAAYAAAAGPVAAATATLFATAQPALSGKPAVGSALTVGPGSWSVKTASATVTWERCNANGRLCTAIAGATASSYTVTAADAGHVLVAVVHASAGGATQTALSTALLATTG